MKCYLVILLYLMQIKVTSIIVNFTCFGNNRNSKIILDNIKNGNIFIINKVLIDSDSEF